MNGMPDLSGNIEEIQSTLKASFNRGPEDIDQDVVARSKRVLMHSISFTSASKPYSIKSNELKAKYTSLNPSSSKQGWSGAASLKSPVAGKDMNSNNSEHQNGESLPIPKNILYPEDSIKMEWTRMSRIGAGLVNMGNTCFFNSTLQCLTYTAPLVNYCLSNDHRGKCRKKDFCMMCEIQSHIKTTLECGGRSIKPHSMLQKLRCIAKHMKWGRQEDAHEFLRFVVDHLQQSCLNGETKLDQSSKETTVINQIFGGYLRSQVTCLRCQAKSNTFDPFMDLSLDIKGVNTLEDALMKFVKPEILEQDNAYKCPKCRNKVRAQKRFSIQKAPNILTVQLNRFDFNRHLSGKINKFIKYPERINLRNFMSLRQGDPVHYQLYGVLVHSGHSPDHGHYYSYVKSPSKTWYCMNDSTVHQTGYNTVFSADAYVLFYARINKSLSVPSPNPKPSFSSSTKNSFIGPVLPNHLKEKPALTNGIHGKPSSELGTPVQRQQPKGVSPFFSTNGGSKIVTHHNSSPLSLNTSHQKISFPILTALQKKQLQQQEDGKRIVLQIKHGNSTTMEKSPDGKSKVVNGNISKLPWQPKSGLVPYNDDSDSEQESGNGAASVSQNKIGNISSGASTTTNGQHTPQAHSMKASGDSTYSKPGSTKFQPPSLNGSGDFSSNNKDNLAGKKPQHFSPFIWKEDSSKASSSKSTSHQLSDKENRSSFLTRTKLEDNISTVKQSLSALELPSSSGKVKSTTTNWCVQQQDGAPSPRGSCSSTNSVNSTSEWTVEAKGNMAASKLQKLTDREPPNGMSAKLASSLFSSTATPVRKEMFNSHIPKPENRQTSGDSRKNGSLQVDVHFTPVDISDRKQLLSPSSSQSSDSCIRKGKTNKKKHKRDEKPGGAGDSREGSSSRSDSSSKKKNKYKKMKEDKRKPSSHRSYDSDSDDNSDCRSKSKKYRKSRSTSPSSHSDSSDAYEWVEKTHETVSRKKKKPHKEASTQFWNHHIKDDLAPRKEKQIEKKSTWDGARESKLAQDCNGSSQGYKSKVLSWNGGKSQLDQDLEAEKSVKRRWTDDYNEDIDSGKTKKVRKSMSDSGFSSYNPFQNQQSQKEKYHGPSWSHQDHSYHHQQDHHYNKKASSIRPSWHSNKNYHSKQKQGNKAYN